MQTIIMQKQIHSTAIVLMLGAATALAQEDTTGTALAAKLEQPAPANLNHVGASYRAAFNVGVKFQNLGGFAPMPLSPRIPGPISPGPDTGYQENRVYEDGYNMLDDNLNDYGDLHATRNWAYLNSTQVKDTESGQFVAMHVTSSAATAATSKLDDDPLNGFEINYLRELQNHGNWKWGVGAAFDFTSIGVSDGHPLQGSVNRLTDWFAVPPDGLVPDAPYFGSNSEGPLLGSEPVVPPDGRNQTFPGAATITGRRHFDANIFGFKAGPYIELPLYDKLSFNLGAGLALVYISSDFSYSPETVTIDPAVDPSGLLTQTHPGGSSSKSGLQLGGYVNANLTWMLNENWGVLGGVEFLGSGSYTHQDPVSGKAAKLDIGKTLACFLGVSYSF